MTKQTKAERKAAYLARFEDIVVTAKPSLAGRICWDTAKFFYYQNTPVTEAAKRYLTTTEE